MFAWKGETCAEYWQCTLDALTWENGEGPDLIVDDGGDATILLLFGLESEKKFKENGVLPNADRSMCEDEYELWSLIRKTIEKDSDTFTRLNKNLKGVSE